MSKSIFKKTVAAVCSAATLVSIGVTAMMANAQETLDPAEREGLSTSVANIIADQVYAEPGEKVTYAINIVNNQGYSGSGFTITYDERLTPDIKEGTEDTPVTKGGDASADLVKSTSLNLPLYIFACSTAGSQDLNEDDGIYIRTSFTVPKDAKPGDTFPMILTVSKFIDTHNQPVDYESFDGWIKIKADDTTTTTTETTTTTTTTETTTTTTTTETTTTTTTTETTTTTTTTETETSTTTTTTETETSTTTTTTETEPPVVTTTTETEPPVVTTTTETEPPVVTTTTETETQAPITETSTEAPADTTTTTTVSETDQTTASQTNPTVPPAGTTAAPPVKTGDAGVGAAVAGLLLAGAAAVAVATKKKED
ncbi:MAG: hypothetical protein IJ060_00730 [Oscillospiraceae bacterium]|nr:hypothetical protein [Oscillospiraceae bacterium]